MTQPHNKKSRRKSSPSLSKLTPEQAKIYDRVNCQKCNQPISRELLEERKKKRFWPICKECEKVVIPIYQKAQKMLAAKQKNFLK